MWRPETILTSCPQPSTIILRIRAFKPHWMHFKNWLRLQIPREAPFPNEVLLRLFKGVHCTLLSRVQPGSIYRGEWAVYTRLLLVGVRQRSLGERGGQAGTHGNLGCVDCGLNEIMLQVPGYRILYCLVVSFVLRIFLLVYFVLCSYAWLAHIQVGGNNNDLFFNK
jgi:hypothetical protein